MENLNATHPVCLTVVFMRSASPLAALALAVGVLLTGCVPQPPDIEPPPEPTTEPVFASDEEALAAATDAYKAYLAMSDLIGQRGGQDASELAQVAVGQALATTLEEFDMFVDEGLRSTGGTQLAAMELQSYRLEAVDGVDVVTVYACLDVSGVDVHKQDGTSAVSDSRRDRQFLEVSFDLDTSGSLLVSLIEPWPGEREC